MGSDQHGRATRQRRILCDSALDGLCNRGEENGMGVEKMSRFRIGKLQGKFCIRRIADNALMAKFQMKKTDEFDVKCWLEFFEGYYGKQK
jgi:hypothetical protein